MSVFFVTVRVQPGDVERAIDAGIGIIPAGSPIELNTLYIERNEYGGYVVFLQGINDFTRMTLGAYTTWEDAAKNAVSFESTFRYYSKGAQAA